MPWQSKRVRGSLVCPRGDTFLMASLLTGARADTGLRLYGDLWPIRCAVRRYSVATRSCGASGTRYVTMRGLIGRRRVPSGFALGQNFSNLFPRRLGGPAFLETFPEIWIGARPARASFYFDKFRLSICTRRPTFRKCVCLLTSCAAPPLSPPPFIESLRILVNLQLERRARNRAAVRVLGITPT
eukprot:7111586-Prymnesium_polylepis.2